LKFEIRLLDSNKRELPPCFSFFSIGEEKVSMTTRTEVDPEDLFFFDPFFFDLGHVDTDQVYHPFPISYGNRKGFPFRGKDVFIDFIAAESDGRAQGNKKVFG
jgi:hypothetical protein